jgi:hypothetical protein
MKVRPSDKECSSEGSQQDSPERKKIRRVSCSEESLHEYVEVRQQDDEDVFKEEDALRGMQYIVPDSECQRCMLDSVESLGGFYLPSELDDSVRVVMQVNDKECSCMHLESLQQDSAERKKIKRVAFEESLREYIEFGKQDEENIWQADYALCDTQ